MLSNDFRIYQEFHSKEALKEAIEVIRGNGIEWQVEDSTIGNPFDIDQEFGCFLLKVPHEDFESVDKVFEEFAAKRVAEIGEDHYLYDFSSEELKDVVKQFDEWSKEDALIALKILKQRGVGLNQGEIKRLKDERVAESRKPDRADVIWIILGYISAFLGGIIGIALGYHYWLHQKTDVLGYKVFSYDSNTRKQGKVICGIGVVSLFIFLLFRIIGVW